MNDFYDIFERFSIMTVDGGLSDLEALLKLKPLISDSDYKKLLNTISK